MKKNFKPNQRLLLLSAILLLALRPSIAHAHHHSNPASAKSQALQQSPAQPCLLEQGLSAFRLGTHSPRRVIAKRIPEVPNHSRRVLHLKASLTLGKILAGPSSLSPFVPQQFRVLRI